MSKTLYIILTAVLAIGIILVSCESTTGPDGPQETDNEQGEGLEAAADVVAGFFEVDSTDRVQAGIDVVMFLRIEDIPGESTDEAHKGEIDIHGIELGRTVRIFRAPNGREAGHVLVKDFSFTKWVDKASPLLEKAAVSAEVFPAATLSIRKEGDRQAECLRIKMEKVRVTSYQTAGTDNTPIPTEEVTFNFTKIEWE